MHIKDKQSYGKTVIDIKFKRLARQIARRDKRIAGLERKIQRLESALAYRNMDLESLTRNVQNEVQQALCNVRMIPVNNLTKHNKVLEIKVVSAD